MNNINLLNWLLHDLRLRATVCSLIIHELCFSNFYTIVNELAGGQGDMKLQVGSVVLYKRGNRNEIAPPHYPWFTH